MSHAPKPVCVRPGERVRLAEIDPRHVEDEWTKKRARKQIEKNVAATADLAYRLYAENRRALLMVLQGMDTSGKDGQQEQ